MKVLVVDDDPQGVYLLEQFLQARGHSVWSAGDGRDALSLCEERGAPDAVLSDALMPRMDGFELCSALRQRPEFCHVKFILYTATYTDDENERFALSAGVDRFVVKPVEPERLLGMLTDLVASAGPPRLPSPQSPSGFLEQHARLLSVKLEQKVVELGATNAELVKSERAVRELNTELLSTIRRLEWESAERQRTIERLHLAEQVGGVGSVEWNESTDELSWSSEAKRMLGLERPSYQEFLDNVQPEDRARVAFFWRDGLRTGQTEQELRYRRPGAMESATLVLRCARIAAGAGGARRMLTLHDVSGRRASEAARQALEAQLYQAKKMESLGKLAGGIAHDFNNILTVIGANCDLLSIGDGCSAEARTLVHEISNAANQARETIRQIMLFSRKEQVERHVFEARTLLQKAVAPVRKVLPAGITLEVKADSSRHVLANEVQFQRLVMNLCTNAAHAMRGRGGVLLVQMESVDLDAKEVSKRQPLAPGPAVKLSVVDSGVGMEPHVIERVFEPFFTTKPVGEGTGLGLSVVHGIVRSHEGFVAVESELGRGTTVSIWLHAVDGSSETASADARQPGRGQRVLVVDDEPSVARGLSQMLERLGCGVEAFTDPAEARRRFLEEPQRFTLAILDCLMPAINGYDLASSLWDSRRELPIILVASFGSQPDPVRARELGFCAVLMKPLSGAALASAIAAALAAPSK